MTGTVEAESRMQRRNITSPSPPPQASRQQLFSALVAGNEGDESDTDNSANKIESGDSDDEVCT